MIVGDATRYWSVNGEPVREELSFTYAPNDWRAVELPEAMHAYFVDDLQRLLFEQASSVVLVDGDGNPYSPDPEQVVNRWLIVSRSVSHSLGIPVGDVLFADDPAADRPELFNPFVRPVRKGVVGIEQAEFDRLVAARHSRAMDDVARWAEESVAAAGVEWDALADRLGADVVTMLRGPRPTVEMMMRPFVEGT